MSRQERSNQKQYRLRLRYSHTERWNCPKSGWRPNMALRPVNRLLTERSAIRLATDLCWNNHYTDYRAPVWSTSRCHADSLTECFETSRSSTKLDSFGELGNPRTMQSIDTWRHRVSNITATVETVAYVNSVCFINDSCNNSISVLAKPQS